MSEDEKRFGLLVIMSTTEIRRFDVEPLRLFARILSPLRDELLIVKGIAMRRWAEGDPLLVDWWFSSKIKHLNNNNINDEESSWGKNIL